MKKFIKYILSITGYKFVKRVGFKIIIQKETKLDKLLKRKYDPNLSLEEKKYIINNDLKNMQVISLILITRKLLMKNYIG